MIYYGTSSIQKRRLSQAWPRAISKYQLVGYNLLKLPTFNILSRTEQSALLFSRHHYNRYTLLSGINPKLYNFGWRQIKVYTIIKISRDSRWRSQIWNVACGRARKDDENHRLIPIGKDQMIHENLILKCPLLGWYLWIANCITSVLYCEISKYMVWLFIPHFFLYGSRFFRRMYL